MRGGTGNMTSNNFFPSHQLASQNSALLSQTTSSKQAIGSYANRNGKNNGQANAEGKFDQQMTQNLLRQSGHGVNQAEMLRVADLVTNPSQEYVQQREMAIAAAQNGKQVLEQNGGPNGAVTSADIR